MKQLIQLFKNSKNYAIMETIDGEVAVNGFSSGSVRKLLVGMQLQLIGGKLTKEGYSYFKSRGVDAPIKIHNGHRLSKSVTKVLPLTCLVTGDFDCGLPFKRGTLFHMLGGKTKEAKLVSFLNGGVYYLTIKPSEVIEYFLPHFVEETNLKDGDRSYTNNMNSDYVSNHFGKQVGRY